MAKENFVFILIRPNLLNVIKMAETVSIAKEREYLNCSDSNAAPSDNDHRGIVWLY